MPNETHEEYMKRILQDKMFGLDKVHKDAEETYESNIQVQPISTDWTQKRTTDLNQYTRTARFSCKQPNISNTPKAMPTELPNFFKSFLDQLREANNSRMYKWCPSGTTASFKGLELAGEAGEVCNAIKKLERFRMGVSGGSDDRTNLADEIGDVMICLDLLASHYDLSLEQCTKFKFNKTSEKYGFDERL